MIRNPELPLHGYVSAAGSRWGIRSNSAAVLQSAAKTFPSLSHRGRVDLNLDLYVDTKAATQALWSVPHFRGRDHLVFAAYGTNDCVLVDLRRKRVIGRFSPAIAADTGYWKHVIFPILLGITAAAVGVTALHCACLCYQSEALLITGESGAGKSTLSFELARRGLDFVSDDWTYFHRTGTEVMACGLPTKIKLLPDSIAFFAQLHGSTPVPHLNGELALEISPEEVGLKRALCCRPTRILLLDRQPGCNFAAARLAANEIAAYFEQSLERLPSCLAQHRESQLATIRALSQTESWYLRCGGSPQEIATHILRLCDLMPSTPAPAVWPLPLKRREWPDMLRRFVPLQLRQHLSYDGCSFEVTTDSGRIRRALRSITKPATVSTPPVTWTILEEPEWPADGTASHGLAAGGLSFLTVGGRSFLACDRNAERATACIAAASTDQEMNRTLETMLSHLVYERTIADRSMSSVFAPADPSRERNMLRNADA